jgi:PiT family inorganic phosphate transporter
VLSPRNAVLMSAALNFLGAMASRKVAMTIGKGIVDPADITITVTLAAVAAAIIWDLVTWYLSLPSSSHHALVGGIVGATVVASGVGVLHLNVLGRILLAVVFSPVMGFIVGNLSMRLLASLFRRASAYTTGVWFRKLQLFSAAFMSFSHGENDAQQSMGIITAALVIWGKHEAARGGAFTIPVWVVATCAFWIAMGTTVGGWRIIKTMGVRMLRLRPIDGFAGETSAAGLIHIASRLGLPVSTTHTITSSLMGVGAARRLTAVRWSVAKSIVLAWLVTLPASALIGAGLRLILGR